MPHEVIMPALGMAQDSGVLVAWLKPAGAKVVTGEPLFEVETDKAVMEVEAAHDGYLTGLRAGEGEAVPVGQVVAVIADSPEAAEAPAAPAPAAKAAPSETPAPEARPEPPAPPQRAAATPAAARPEAPAREGRILASPKARRVAAEQGLDLARLRAAGHPEPYHVADLDTLRAMPAAAGAATTARLTLSARVPGAALEDFQALLAGQGVELPRAAILAAFAAGALRAATGADRLNVQAGGVAAGPVLADPDLCPLGEMQEAQEAAAPPDLVLRDLGGTRLSSAALGEPVPALTITGDVEDLALALDAPADRLTPDAALALLAGLAARIEEPLCHLL